MAIIDQYDKRSGITYVYESKSEWVPELKQSRAKRTLIGKRDPVTREVIPTNKHRKKVSDKSSEDNNRNDDYYEKLESLLTQQRETTDQLNKTVKELDKINSDLNKLLRNK